MSSTGPLAGILVVGLEHSVAGPLCTRILGDLGATVIKLEPPRGDFARRWDENVGGECAQFWWLNRRKRSIALDLKSVTGRAAFERLLEQADALVTNLIPSAMERLGLTPAALSERFPSLVTCHISGYGRTGSLRERKAYDMLVQAETGIMSLTGSPEQAARVGVSIADVGSGIYAAALTLGGLLGRTRNGQGAYLDVAMYDATLEFAGPMLISFLNAGVLYPRLPDRHHAIAPYGVFHCSDGSPLVVAIQTDAEWRVFAARMLDSPELADDPRFATSVARLENRQQVERLAAEAVAALTKTEALRRLDELRIAYGSINDMQDVAEHPVVAERAMLGRFETSSGFRATSLTGIGERLFGTPADGRERPPDIGEDTEEILDMLGLSVEYEAAGEPPPP